jgi:hypothetical protein
MTFAFSVAVTVVFVVPTPLIPALVTAAILTIGMLLLVAGSVFAFVPAILHKEYALAAGVIFAAMFAPVSGVIGRNAQIDRRAFHRSPLDNHRLRKYEWWPRKVADVESTVKSGLANAD